MAEEKKVKEIPWTEPKMLYKDVEENGFDVYRKFNWETWRRMTEGERSMWTESSESTPAPISKEVIEFNKKTATKKDKVVKPKSKANSNGSDPIIMSAPIDTDIPPTEEDQKEAIKTKLKERGIRFTHNSKLETLQKKLADADNPE